MIIFKYSKFKWLISCYCNNFHINTPITKRTSIPLVLTYHLLLNIPPTFGPIFGPTGDTLFGKNGDTFGPGPNGDTFGPGSIGSTTFTFEFVLGKKFWF